MSQVTVPFPHPLQRCLDEIGAALDGAEGADPGRLPTEAKRETLLGLTRVINRLEGVRLAVLAVAADVADEAGARSAGAWLANEAHLDAAAGRRLQRLADAVSADCPDVGSALRAGDVDVSRAEAIVRSLEELPVDVGAEVRRAAEQRLVVLAGEFAPRPLRTLGRRILEVVAPEVAEDHERRLLERDERYARSRMRITTHDLGNGLVRAVVDVPRLSMDLWLTQLHAFASPRRDHLGPEPADTLGIGRQERLTYPQRLAHAFCAMLERPPGPLPHHGGDTTNLLVTIDLDRLVSGLGTAGLSSGESISAGEARRLACNSKLIPVVLGGKSQPLDVGRARRLFSPAQRKAMAVRDQTCRAAGCDVPAAWCEAHHLQPWSRGGRTDLADGLLLCSFHHHRAHDQRYSLRQQPSGDVRFHLRR